ncbi:MAG: hypothetical protein AAF602_12100 [Myxococcota bacterium]
MTYRPLIALTLAGCLPLDGNPAPSVEPVDPSIDAALDLVDRTAILADAVEGTAGPAPDLAAAPDAFFFDIDGSDVTEVVDDHDGLRAVAPTYDAVITATAAVVLADVAALAVVGPPAVAIAFAANGELTENTPWHWTATNVAGDATFTLDVAFVGVGWLAEMRVGDGSSGDPIWFDGFLGLNAAVGWWNIRDQGDIVGVVEWTADGSGNGQAAIAAVGPNPEAGDILAFGSTASGERSVSLYDAGPDFLNRVVVYPDDSGEVTLLDTNGGLPLCWGPDLADVACAP